ncbi:MAG: carbamoyl-phosphate synthase small subunit [Alphaproteobacteria bacterium]|nr:carbamoyl-phosphate synthase small subunit [Alphaproteobacteria bacterium]
MPSTQPYAPEPWSTGSDSRSSAVLVLADGSVFSGRGIGAAGEAVGEVCFNTAITGYEEILTDPSYAGQIITFTFPHIGNAGCNEEDLEAGKPAARGVILRADITGPSNYRAHEHLDAWLKSKNIIGICGIDTRALTRRIREKGMPHGVIHHDVSGDFDHPALAAKAAAWPGLNGMDLAITVTRTQTEAWDETMWDWRQGYARPAKPVHHVVAVDYGVKRNILRCLASAGCKVTIVPATATAEEILGHAPDGVFLSNGPGDPAATGVYAVPVIRQLINSGKPVFGICLGHQMLALALGARTGKMPQGHHGANHPVKDLTTGKVEITSMNHGFTVLRETLPKGVRETHISLFDGTNCGLAVEGKPVFSVQYHPEASPGPQDSTYLFERFAKMMGAK